MDKMLPPELDRLWREMLAEAQQPEWLREMHEHYWRTGTYRAQDLRRLLGDPTKGVEIGAQSGLAAYLEGRRHNS